MENEIKVDDNLRKTFPEKAVQRKNLIELLQAINKIF